jgi:hypothetical protein
MLASITAARNVPILGQPQPPQASPDGWAQSSSGLCVPGVQVPTPGGLVVAKAEDLDRADVIAHEQLDALGQQYGAGAADAMVGAQIVVADRVRSDIEHQKVIDAFYRGRIETPDAG